jgi:hypothetical protein
MNINMDWYKTLSIHQKINAKNCFELATGIEFSALSLLFSYKERIDMLYNKLLIEGFNVCV